jgi:hypothetical protein
MQSMEDGLSRPKRVVIAIILLYISLGLWIAGLGIKLSPASKHFWFTLTVSIATCAILFFLMYMVGKGKNWARITLFVVFIFDSPPAVLSLWKSLAAGHINNGIYLISLFALIIAAFIMVFQKESNQWFNRVATIALQSEFNVGMPKLVKTAITFLYIRLGIDFYFDAVRVLAFFLGVAELELDFKPKSSIGIFVATHVWAVLTMMIIRDATSLFLVYMTGKGKNWARIIILLGCILSIPEFFWRLPQLMVDKPITFISNIPLLILPVVALIYLFQKESNDWFKKSGKIAEPHSHPASGL